MIKNETKIYCRQLTLQDKYINIIYNQYINVQWNNPKISQVLIYCQNSKSQHLKCPKGSEVMHICLA